MIIIIILSLNLSLFIIVNHCHMSFYDCQLSLIAYFLNFLQGINRNVRAELISWNAACIRALEIAVPLRYGKVKPD